MANGNGTNIDYRGWGKVILELAILLMGMAFWFSRLENRVDRTVEWMVHHIESEHKERAVMHHRQFEKSTCMECKSSTNDRSIIGGSPSFNNRRE